MMAEDYPNPQNVPRSILRPWTVTVVARALRSNGRLLVVEDYMMPQGEHSHRYGFVCLNAEQLKALFATNNEEGFLSVDASGKYAGRIRSHLIPAISFSRVSAETRKNALKLVREEAKTAIHRLRSAKHTTYRKGLEHAFWTQQYANSGLAIEEV
ncbi:MAG: hypothetical protein O3C40_08485, partial [Planctomycetota bacterium]|nr:hypothetical protein [Planctomycetota bacterium]